MKKSLWIGLAALFALCLPLQAQDKQADNKRSSQSENLQKTAENQPLFKDGKGYYSYKQPLSIPLPENKVLIQYFYEYGCEICLNASDYLKNYAARHGDKVTLVESPSFKASEFTSRMRATFVEYGRPELGDKYFFDSAGKKDAKLLTKDNMAIQRWLNNNGVNIGRFHQLFESEQVKQRVQQDSKLYRTYSPPLYPIAVLNGKYILISNTLYNDDYTYAVLDFLVDKLQQEKQEKTQ